MKWLRYNTLYSIIVILFSVQISAKPLINSHLRTWTETEVSAHFLSGADIVEIDITTLMDPELHKIMLKLPQFSGQILALHLKGFNEKSIPEIETFLMQYKSLWQQFWFFSGDTKIDLHIKTNFSIAYITRSTKHDVISCLSFGLEDDEKFLSHCINKDLWVRPSMMSNNLQKNRMKQLLNKIRNYEQMHLVPPSLIALDQIDNMDLYCEYVPDFRALIDGIVTEDFKAILPILNGHQTCN